MINNPKVGEKVWYAANLPVAEVWEATVIGVPGDIPYEIDIQVDHISNRIGRRKEYLFYNQEDARNCVR